MNVELDTSRPVEATSAEVDQKLTDWKNEPTVANLKADLEGSKGSHDAQVRKISEWVDLLEVKGTAKVPKIAGRSSVQPRLIRRQNEWRYSALSEPFLGSDKLFNVKPTTHEDREAAIQNELVLNQQFRTKIDRVSFIDEYVRTVVDEGTAILRVGWNRETAMVPTEVPVFQHFELTEQDPRAQAFVQAFKLRDANPAEYEARVDEGVKAAIDYFDETEVPTYTVLKEMKTQDVEEIIDNRPTVELVNYQNVYIDPSCGADLDKAMFIIYSFETSKAELQKASIEYKNLEHVDFAAAGPVNTNEHTPTTSDTSFQFNDAARKRIVAFEYWGFYDIHGKGELTPIVATWIGNVLIRVEENPYPDQKLPFILVPYMPVKRSVYGETDAELLGDNQRIHGAVSRGMIDLLGRSANAQQGYAKGMLDPLNKRRFEAGQNYEYNPIQHPTNGYIEHKYPELPRSALEMVQMQNQEAEAMSGVKSFSGGMSGEAYGDVAAGIRGMLDAASKREMAILRRLSNGLVKLGRKFISMNTAFMSRAEVVRMTNDQFVEVTKEDLQHAAEFDLIIDISTAEVDDAQAKDLGFLLQTVGPNMEPEVRNMMLGDIARLKRMPDLAQRLYDYQPQPDPVAEKMKELTVAKLEFEIEQIKAKTQLMQAQAQKAIAEAGQAELDAAEQAAGVSHERSMEQQQGQAQGNKDLAVTRALLAPKKEGEGSPDVEAAIGFNALTDKAPVGLPSGGVDTTMERDALAADDPSYSLGSRFFDPSQDPALNPGLNLG
jgi:hypothetical protein